MNLGGWGSCMKQRRKRARGERERDALEGLPSRSVSSSPGSPKAQGRHMRVLAKEQGQASNELRSELLR